MLAVVDERASVDVLVEEERATGVVLLSIDQPADVFVSIFLVYGNRVS